MNRMLHRALLASWLCMLVAACAPLGQPATQPANTQSGFPTLGALASQAPATRTRPAPEVAGPPGSALPTVMVQPQAYPIPLIGTGNQEVQVDKWAGPALLHAKYTGGDSFGVQASRAVSGDLATLKTLINTLGPYEGTVPLDFEPGQPTSRLMVTASGPWVIDIQPLASAKPYQIPVTINSQGEDVVLLSGEVVRSIMALARGGGSFIVVGYTESGERVELLNELSPYSGIIPVDKAVTALAIHASGPWSLQISAK